MASIPLNRINSGKLATVKVEDAERGQLIAVEGKLRSLFRRTGSRLYVSHDKNAGLIQIAGIPENRLDYFGEALCRFASEVGIGIDGKITYSDWQKPIAERKTSTETKNGHKYRSKGFRNQRRFRPFLNGRPNNVVFRDEVKPGWTDNIVSYFRVRDGTYGTAWKPGTKFQDLTLQTHVDLEEVYRVHLRPPVQTYNAEIEGMGITAIVAPGYVARSPSYRRSINALDERKTENKIVWQLVNAVANSGYAKRLPGNYVRKVADGNVSVIARRIR